MNTEGKSILRLTPEQWQTLDDGLCPECTAPLLNGREEACPKCGAGPYGDEVELDLSGVENVRICRPIKKQKEEKLYTPDPITQYFHILLGLYTWWGHGWLAGIAAGVGYYLLIIAINHFYFFVIGGGKNWVRTLQRIKWVTFIAATVVIGII